MMTLVGNCGQLKTCVPQARICEPPFRLSRPTFFLPIWETDFIQGWYWEELRSLCEGAEP